ncbi:MAG TPA: hypothetical protein VKB49_20130 [Candidatus Sulfotelmatobacter sp.]|nr:hypothetical protein [Candidatus Sulfotelmatobacter sp.]
MKHLQNTPWARMISSAALTTGLVASLLAGSVMAAPQNSSLASVVADTTTENQGVPRLVRFSGVVKDSAGAVPSGDVTLTFSLDEQKNGGSPLWSETQTVQLSKDGRYTVLLGFASADGLPRDLFMTNRARWVAVQPGIAGMNELPRVLLVGVPYAIKAADAETLGGLPASAFLLANTASPSTAAPAADSASTTAPVPPASTVTGTGTTDYIPIWTGTSTLGNSSLFQTGSGSTAKVGIGTTTPATTLDVKGGSTVRGTLTMTSTGTATATSGKNSQPVFFTASAFNSTSKSATNETFQWQSEPAGNDTASPSGTLNLLFGSGSSKTAETGLSIAPNGQISFALGQTFPTNKVVTTLNSLTGNVSLAAGSNITITPSGNTLTIASTGSLTVTHDATLTGSGTTTSPLGIAIPMTLSGNSGNAIVQGVNANGDGVVGTSGAGDGVNGNSSVINKSGVYGSSSANGGYGVFGRNAVDGSTGFLGKVAIGAGGTSASPAAGTAGVYGVSQVPASIGIVDAAGVWGDSFAGDGIVATSSQNNGIVAITRRLGQSVQRRRFYRQRKRESRGCCHADIRRECRRRLHHHHRRRPGLHRVEVRGCSGRPWNAPGGSLRNRVAAELV